MNAFIGLLVRLVICGNSGYGMDASHPKCIIPQGMIEMDSEFAKKIGFVSSRFLSCCYLWGEGNRIVIKTIECTGRRRGYLRELFKAIWPGARPKLWEGGALGEIDRRCRTFWRCTHRLRDLHTVNYTIVQTGLRGHGNFLNTFLTL
jgi:hypothetical protein